MQFYWKCEECDEVNPYPDVKVCETCGTPMSAAAEKRVLQEQKEEQQRQEALRREEERKRLEEQRARLEAERKRQAELEAARRAEEERKRKAEIERKLRLKLERETKFSTAYTKVTHFLCGAVRVVTILAIVLGFVLAIANFDRWDNFENALFSLSFNIINEKDAHTVLENGETGSRLLHNLSRPPMAFKGVFSNIGQQLAYLWDSYTPVENVTQFIEDLSEFLSGG